MSTMTPTTTRLRDPILPTQRVCAQCEYFDAEFGDCLNPASDRFQTSANSDACSAFYPDTTKRPQL